jgi:hypothetical protein
MCCVDEQMEASDLAGALETVETWVFDEYKQISRKYVSAELNFAINAAAQIMDAFVAKNKERIDIIHHISGVNHDHNRDVKIVGDADLDGNLHIAIAVLSSRQNASDV